DDGAIWVTRRGGRERRDAAGPDTGRAVHRRLEVVGEIVPAADDDRLLPPAADVELAVGHVPEITGGEPAVADDLARRLRPAQVTLHHRRAGDEDLADDALAHGPPARVGHAKPVARERAAARDQTRGIRGVGRARPGAPR